MLLWAFRVGFAAAPQNRERFFGGYAEGWRLTAATLKEASVEFEMVWDPNDGGFSAIKEAYFSAEPLALFVSDGNEKGLDADFVVTSFSRSEPLEEALTVSVTCKPTLVNRAPTWKG